MVEKRACRSATCIQEIGQIFTIFVNRLSLSKIRKWGRVGGSKSKLIWCIFDHILGYFNLFSGPNQGEKCRISG